MLRKFFSPKVIVLVKRKGRGRLRISNFFSNHDCIGKGEGLRILEVNGLAKVLAPGLAFARDD